MKATKKAVRLLLLTIGTCFIVLTGALYQGMTAYAKETGHTTITVNTDALRVRQEPSLSAKCYGLIGRGETYRYIETIDSEWIRIDYKGMTAYVASAYVIMNEPEVLVEEIVEEIVIEETKPKYAFTEISASVVIQKLEEAALGEAAIEAVVELPAIEEIKEQESIVEAPTAEFLVIEEVQESEAVAEILTDELPVMEEVQESEAVAEALAEELPLTEEVQESEPVAELPQVDATQAIAEPMVVQNISETPEIAIVQEIPAEEELSEEVKLLAALIYCEAGGECYEGQLAVGAVVLNRMQDPRFPDTMYDVIYQKGQFVPAGNGKVDRILEKNAMTESCINAAKEALTGVSNVGDLVSFRRAGKRDGLVIGNHVFF